MITVHLGDYHKYCHGTKNNIISIILREFLSEALWRPEKGSTGGVTDMMS